VLQLADAGIEVAWAIEVSQDGGATWRGGGGARTESRITKAAAVTTSHFRIALTGAGNPLRRLRGTLALSHALSTAIEFMFDDAPMPVGPETPLHHSVAFDATKFVAGSAVTSLTTASFTISGSNRAAMVGLSTAGGSAPSSVSATVGGVGGSLVSGTSQANGTTRVQIWAVTAPAAGSGKTASMSWTNSATKACLGVVTATGVDQATPVNNGTGQTGTTPDPSMTVVSVTGDLVVSVLALDGISAETIDTFSGGIRDWRDPSFGNTIGAGLHKDGASLVTVEWYTNGAYTYAHAGANFKQASLFALSVSDVATATESVICALQFVLSTADVDTATEFVALAPSVLLPNVTDTPTLTDIVTIPFHAHMSVFDDASAITENVSVGILVPIAVYEQINEVEAVNVGIQIAIVIAETAPVTEDVDVSIRYLLIFDATPAMEQVTLVIGTQPSVVDSTSLAEAITVVLPLSITLFDAVAITEMVTQALIDAANVADTWDRTESTTLKLPLRCMITEAIAVTENITVRPPGVLSLSDVLTVTEFIQLHPNRLNVVTADAVGVQDIISLHRMGVVQISDNVNPTDIAMVGGAILTTPPDTQGGGGCGDTAGLWRPTWLIDLSGIDPIPTGYTASELRFAPVDIDALSPPYHGRLVDLPTVDRSLADVFWGVRDIADMRFTLTNGDGYLTNLFLLADLREQPVIIHRYDIAGAVIVDTVNGRISSIGLENGKLILTVRSIALTLAEQLVPSKLITATEFPKAVDLQAVIPVIFGNPIQMLCPYINDDVLLDQYDYMVGYGSLTVDRLYRNGPNNTMETISTSEYTVSTSLYSGYTVVRFPMRQIDFSDAFYKIYANVLGVSRSFANAIKDVLSNATWGLGQLVSASSLALATTDLNNLGNLFCDGVLDKQIQAQDLLGQLLIVRGMRLGFDAAGEWTLTVDRPASVISMTVDSGTVVTAGPRKKVETQNAVSVYTVRYQPDFPNGSVLQGSQSRTLSTFGKEKTIDLPLIRDHTTADAVCDYLAKRELYGQETAEFELPQEARRLVEGNIILVTYAPTGYANDIVEVRSVSKTLETVRVVVVSWNGLIYVYEPGIIPPTLPPPGGPAPTIDPLLVPTGLTLFSDLLMDTDGQLQVFLDTLWDSVGGATSYDVQFKRQADAVWTTRSVPADVVLPIVSVDRTIFVANAIALTSIELYTSKAGAVMHNHQTALSGSYLTPCLRHASGRISGGPSGMYVLYSPDFLANDTMLVSGWLTSADPDDFITAMTGGADPTTIYGADKVFKSIYASGAWSAPTLMFRKLGYTINDTSTIRLDGRLVMYFTALANQDAWPVIIVSHTNVGVAISDDNGATWVDQGLLIPYAASGDGQGAWSPAVVLGPDGNLWLYYHSGTTDFTQPITWRQRLTATGLAMSGAAERLSFPDDNGVTLLSNVGAATRDSAVDTSFTLYFATGYDTPGSMAINSLDITVPA
jgi:hypothetical protein